MSSHHPTTLFTHVGVDTATVLLSE